MKLSDMYLIFTQKGCSEWATLLRFGFNFFMRRSISFVCSAVHLSLSLFFGTGKGVRPKTGKSDGARSMLQRRGKKQPPDKAAVKLLILKTKEMAL
jgi:hypothetical protein